MQIVYISLIIVFFIVLFRLAFRKLFRFPLYSGKMFTQYLNVDNLMNEEKFWQIINHSIDKSKRHYSNQCHVLTEYLSTLNNDEIIQFDRTFGLLLAQSYSYRLWEPVYSLNGGCSDDSFEHFRSWLIAQGKNRFYWAVKYPRLLFFIGVKEIIENYEGIAYSAFDAYQLKTGLDLPSRHDIKYAEGGKMFKETESFLRYPELALLAW